MQQFIERRNIARTPFNVPLHCSVELIGLQVCWPRKITDHQLPEPEITKHIELPYRFRLGSNRMTITPCFFSIAVSNKHAARVWKIRPLTYRAFCNVFMHQTQCAALVRTADQLKRQKSVLMFNFTL